MAKETVKRVGLNGSALCSLLKRVHLRGMVEECLLEVKAGMGSINAVDMSNSIFISCEEELGEMEDTSLGLGKLALLTQFLEGSTEVTYSVESKDKEGTWLTLRKVGHGQIKVLLVEKTQIPTVVQGNAEETKKGMLKLTKDTFAIEQKAVEDLINYIGMLGAASVFIKAKRGVVTACSSPDAEQQFTLRFGKLTNTESEISVEVYSQYLTSVLKSLTWGTGNEPIARIGNEAPLIIQQNDSNLWALTPIA